MTRVYLYCARSGELHEFGWVTPDVYRCLDCAVDEARQDDDLMIGGYA